VDRRNSEAIHASEKSAFGKFRVVRCRDGAERLW
jgi:hypothetical protein